MVGSEQVGVVRGGNQVAGAEVARIAQRRRSDKNGAPDGGFRLLLRILADPVDLVALEHGAVEGRHYLDRHQFSAAAVRAYAEETVVLDAQLADGQGAQPSNSRREQGATRHLGDQVVAEVATRHAQQLHGGEGLALVIGLQAQVATAVAVHAQVLHRAIFPHHQRAQTDVLDQVAVDGSMLQRLLEGDGIALQPTQAVTLDACIADALGVQAFLQNYAFAATFATADFVVADAQAVYPGAYAIALGVDDVALDAER